MSYRGFKRLLGETGLERKTRNLLGCGVIVLMTASFVVYARETEDLAYDQLQNTGRTLIPGVLARTHLTGLERDHLDQQQKQAEESLPTPPTAYRYRLITPNAVRPENQPTTDEAPFLAAFLEDPAETWKDDKRRDEKAYIYYGAVRAVPTCIQCHSTDKVPRPLPDLKPGDLMAVVSVRMSTDLIESGFHQNRALLIAFAIGTTVLILAGSYLIIRYVIVKPVRHLKEVSEAIAAGELNVRSEIQTGDEFEDLSLAFNRMLRNLTTMSDRNRQLLDDQKHKLDELARLNMALHQSDTLKGSFLSTMSHELRTPLNSIIGFSEVLLNAENLTPKQHRYAANIMTSGQQLLALINDVLDLAKMESGRMRLHPEELKPFEVCEQALTLFRDAAEKKNVELRLTASPDLPMIRQDAGKLHQILTNLVSNSVKFTPQGGRVTLTAEVTDGKLVMVVTDTGVGIAPEEQETIFDKFRQSANTLTREQGGTGLGLSIVRELAKLLGGDVALKSDLGLGSTFTVTVTADLKADPLLVFDLPDVP